MKADPIPVAIVGRRPLGHSSMPKEPTIYDLVLMLSMNASEEERAKIVGDVETAISAGGGTIERKQDWGTRALTFRIDHQAEAEYHLLQLQGPAALLESLSHSLKIADGVLRFRIIKVTPGTPPAPDSAPPVIAVAPAQSAGALAAAAAATAAPPAAPPAPSESEEAPAEPAAAEPAAPAAVANGNGNGSSEPAA
jgi:small subunit ribosomal protein S6